MSAFANLLLRLWLHCSINLFIYTFPIRVPTKSKDLPVSLFQALAKLASYLTGRWLWPGGPLGTVGASSSPSSIHVSGPSFTG